MEAIQTHHLMKRTIDSNASQDCVRSVASPKPNQVGTVLLYGIPIVSLYIESQERLCLAQISNTLLKQFSYNEIHNRRVALGITCVQCTPVQLEILRRAGAMPVSSRRCGMITRREAERLCKSFLGDNAPPRLPDDFAFSVHHECAWGCRGSFLPSRYNSSRAKCIKCSYCGLFFSPNKFIFHSHRIGPGDKYVQPDAANFNSWRRHMKLSGDPPEEIVHAWEDVKAMFNGGTRKRLITASPNSSSRSEPSPKRIKETAQITPPLIHAAAAAAVASATVNTVNSTTQFPVRPINIHHPVSVPSTNSTQRISNLNPELQLPFSRTFMMDYMWHHTQNKSNPFQFSSYALPWMKRPGSLLFGQQQTLNDSPNTEETSSPGNSVATATGLIHLSGCTTSTSHVQSSSSNVSTALNGIDAKVLPTFYNNSAFKPVINHQGRNTFPISVGATAAAATVATSTITIAPVNDDQRTSSRNSDLLDQSTSVKESLSSDDEMVDIETTEEEQQQQQQQQQQINMKTSSQCFKFKTTTGSPSPISINIKIPPSSPTIEIENSTEIVWDGFLKKEHQTTRNLTNIDENGKLISALVPNVSTINLPHLSPSSSASSIDSIEHQSSSSTNLLCKSPSLVSGLCCNIIDNSTHHSHHHHQHQHHHHQHQHHHQSMKKTIFIPSSVRPYNNTSLSTPSSSTTTDIRLSSRLAAGTGSPAASSLPPPLQQSISSAVHSPPSPSTASSNSSMNSGSAAIASSPSSSAAVVAAAAAAAVAIAAFNTQHHHHQQHCSSTINSNSNSNNLLSNSNNSNNCSSSICSSQMLNIAAVTAINNQRLSMVNNSTSATASASACAGTSNAGASANTSSTIASVTSSTNNQMNNNNNFNIVNNLSTSGNNMISNSSSNGSSNGSSINNGSNNGSSSCNTNNSSSNNNNSHNNLHNDNILHSNQNLTYAINNHICNSIKNKTDNCINSKHSNYSNNNNTISNNNLINKTLNNDSSNNNSNNNSSTNNNNNNSEFWSVTRFSFEPPTEYRLSSFYKHDITKHFHTFRHGETTTQSNGIG